MPNNDLVKMSCEPCSPKAEKFSDDKSEVLRAQIPDWLVVWSNGGARRRLYRECEFANCSMAMAFTNRVAALAEQERHYPDFSICGCNVSVFWWTPHIGGLHQNDFIMAAKTDVVYDECLLEQYRRSGVPAEVLEVRRKRLQTARQRPDPEIHRCRCQLVDMVRGTFPALTESVKWLAIGIYEQQVLSWLTLKVVMAEDADAVRRLLDVGMEAVEELEAQ